MKTSDVSRKRPRTEDRERTYWSDEDEGNDRRRGEGRRQAGETGKRTSENETPLQSVCVNATATGPSVSLKIVHPKAVRGWLQRLLGDDNLRAFANLP
jgi:hypothetical protein